MATSTVPAFLDAWKAGMEGRDAIADAKVVIATAPTGAPYPKESIQIFDVAADQRATAMGNKRREETYRARGGLLVHELGAGEAKATIARNRAYALLAEIEAMLRADHNVALTVQFAEVQAYDLEQGINKESRWASIEFFIAVKAQLPTN